MAATIKPNVILSEAKDPLRKFRLGERKGTVSTVPQGASHFRYLLLDDPLEKQILRFAQNDS
ncbi:MAG: hypothetical protein ACRD18_04150 [Terriglobia bacterium]